MNSLRFFSAASVLIVAAAAGARAAPGAPPADAVAGEPAVLPRATRYDFTSRINGRSYRVLVAAPFKADPDKFYPVFYVLDGNWYFFAAAENVTEAGNTITPAIVVGVGYPTEDNDAVAYRRALELTPPGGPRGPDAEPTGGGDDFLRVLLEEVKPLVQARYQVDVHRQTLYGKSLGGLMVLRLMFRNPGAFQTYVAASPAIWWNDRVVLADEAAFARQVRAGALRLRLLITSAGEEQYRGYNLLRRWREAQHNRMIDDASDLAGRLAELNPSTVAVQYVIFPDETHVSVSLVSLGRALNFALKP